MGGPRLDRGRGCRRPLAALLSSFACGPQVSWASAATGALRLGARRQGAHARGPETADLAASLDKVAAGLSKEQDTVKALSVSKAKACKEELWEHGERWKAIRAAKDLIADASNDLEVIAADTASLNATIQNLNNQMETAKGNIDKLTLKLKELRDGQKKSEQNAKASLQELSAAISKVAQEEKKAQRRRSLEPAKINAEVTDLRRLAQQLADSATAPSASFLQTGARTALGALSQGSGGTGLLRADKEDLLRARLVALKDFAEKEKELLGLIKSQRDALVGLEASLEEQRPALADSLKRAAEKNRLVVMTRRVLERDEESLQLTQEVCQFEAVEYEESIKLRAKVVSNVQMASKIVGAMGTAVSLAEDLKDLKSTAPSFLQLNSQASLGEAVRQALDAADVGVEEADGGDVALVQAQGAAGALAPSLALAQAQQGAAGPFDKVTEMIRGLLASMREQANEDTDLNQWCLQADADNDRNRLEVKAARDEAAAQVLWAKSAIAGLKEEAVFFEGETERLRGLAAQVAKAKKQNYDMLGAQLSDHKATSKVVGKVVDVLKGLCDLGNMDAMLFQAKRAAHQAHLTPMLLLQRGGASRQMSLGKQGQCEEAVSMLAEASTDLAQLDQETESFRQTYDAEAAKLADATLRAADQRDRDTQNSKAAKAKRVHDLATAEVDQKQKTKDLALIAQAAKSVAQKCSVKETHEERMARRQDEIDSLKSALRVLNGEEVPVETSLLQASGPTQGDPSAGDAGP